jgi:hypothetical protein
MISKAIQSRSDIDANSLLATTFAHPSEVLSNAVLSATEKRCVLAAWASDAFAVEGSPWMRQLPGSADPVPVAHILKALRDLDEDGDDPPPCAGALRLPVLEEAAMAVGF